MKKIEANPSLSFDRLKNQGDVAVLKFEGGLPRGDKAAAILQNASALVDQVPVVLAGYGITDGETKAGAGTLRSAAGSVLKRPGFQRLKS